MLRSGMLMFHPLSSEVLQVGGASQVPHVQQVSFAARLNVSLTAVLHFPAVLHPFH